MTAAILLAATCLCGEAPERANDFFWENDRIGFRAYGPGDVHKWSGIDVFNKATTNNFVVHLLREPNRHGNWHKNVNGLGMDDYAVGPGRGVGGVVHTHSSEATAWAQACREIPCYGTTHADCFHGAVPLARFLTEDEIASDYEGNTGKVIVERFAGSSPLDRPGVLVSGHGPFTWGKTAMKAVDNAVSLEEIAKMACLTEELRAHAPGREVPACVSEKHFLRKHGPGAYYGQS